MRHIRRILLASDFSKPSAKAFATAVALARTAHADLTILHVLVPYTPIVPEQYIGGAMLDRLNVKVNSLGDSTGALEPVVDAQRLADDPAEQGTDERLARDTEEQRPTELPQTSELGEKPQVVLPGLGEADPWIDAQLRPRNTCRDGASDPRGEVVAQLRR